MKNNLWKNQRCGVWDEVVEQKGTLPPSKGSIGSKTQQKKMFVFFWPIFSILGYLSAFCCLFVAKLPLTFAKLNSIPLSRARGPLNDEKVHIKTQLNHAPLKRYHWIILDPWVAVALRSARVLFHVPWSVTLLLPDLGASLTPIICTTCA